MTARLETIAIGDRGIQVITIHMRRSRFSLSNLSIKHRLPLLIGTLLLAVLTASTWASYYGVKEAALEVGRERLQNLTKQLANLSQQSASLLLTKTLTTANDPAIEGFLQSPSEVTRSSAAGVLQQFIAPQDPNGVQVELWDTKHSLLLTVPGGGAPEPVDLQAEFDACTADPYKTYGPMRVVKDNILVPAVAAARDVLGKPIAYLVRWRRISSNPPPKQLTDLLGSGAALYFGNSRGDLFTNLERIVSKPPSDLSSNFDVMLYTRDGNKVMARGQPINGTPWFLAVEIPEQPFLSQANRFLRRLILIDLVLLTVGIAAAFILSSGITRPLKSLTEAASAISAGDYSKPVTIQQKDELGLLASTFNAMTTKVRTSQSELEESLQALRQSEHRLQTVIENLSEGLVVSDLNGQLLSWNRAALEIHGFSSLDEALLKLPEFENIFELSELDGSVLDIEQWPLPRIIRGERLRNLELRIRRIEGNWNRVFNYGGSIVREPSGKLSAIVTMNDITDRKQAEEALQTSEMRYRRLFESAKDGILILNGDNGRIVDVNPYLTEMLGYSEQELAGKELWEISAFKGIIASKTEAAEWLQQGYTHYEDLPLKTRDGLTRHVEFLSISYLAGESQVIQCNIRDITERKLAEQELLRTNERLEAALAELQTKTHELTSMTQQLWQASKLATMGELAASVAHELNNPLATLALHAESLLNRLPGEDPKRRAVEVIDQEVERMATLVSNLLLFSRRSHQQTSTINIDEELQNSLEFIHYHLRSHKINVATDFANDLPSIHADRQQLRQLFLNLLTNASDAMPEGGTLTIRARRGVLNGGAPALIIEFSDTGIGIEPEDLPKLWEPFFTTKPEGKGTGLGLLICRRIVEEHRGTISIESLPGKGTTVRIVLPGTEMEIGKFD